MLICPSHQDKPLKGKKHELTDGNEAGWNLAVSAGSMIQFF